MTEGRERARLAVPTGAAASLSLLLLLLASCATPPRPVSTRTIVPQKEYEAAGVRYRVLGSSAGYSERGVASWYGPGFHGRRTASGEPFDMDKLTAAHRVLPLGTFVRVRRADGRAEAVVRVNDRGPFARDRIIDLSRAAALQLGMLEAGTAEVVVEALGEDRGLREGVRVLQARPDWREGDFTVQVGAFSERENAERLASTFRLAGHSVEVVIYDRGDAVFHRVRAGRFRDLSSAERGKAEFAARGFAGFVVAR